MADRYSHQIARIAVAQMAETTGFDSVQESAVEVLADLMLRYVAQLASASHSYAEVAGRTDCNVNDLVRHTAVHAATATTLAVNKQLVCAATGFQRHGSYFD